MHNLCKLIKLITQISQVFGLFFLWSINSPLCPPAQISLSLLAFITNTLFTCGGQLLESTKWKLFLISDSVPELAGLKEQNRSK